jgi:hypothetical protein
MELLVGQWLKDDCMYDGWCYEADLNYDFEVNFDDFAELGGSWLVGSTIITKE